ncbi:MAG TPA: type VI secretion system baseplate subunit TssG, partial [Luteitalea sp.]|nr:type VI secretion system baseplate subunit TssG [Luteitalea sp.]
MATPLGQQTDVLTFFAALAESPHRHDFYQTLRQLECLFPTRPRWGEALRPADEPVRLGQDPDLAFAPTPLAAFERGTGGVPPRLQVRLFGLLGPNGPMPTHLTEYTRERLRHAGDPT